MSEQVPDHRMNEIMQTIRELKAENQKLKQTIDGIYQRPGQPQEEKLFDDPIENALNKKIHGALTKQEEKFRAQSGFLWDQLDELRFQHKWGSDTYDKYGAQIEQLKKDAEKQGRYLTREEVFKFLKFEESNKKPQPKPEEPKGPRFDPYTGQLIQEVHPETPPAAPVQAQPPVQAQGQQQPAQLPQTPPQQAASVIPTLPPVGPTMTPAAPSAPTGKIDLQTADEKALDSWADRYGDVPL